MKIPVKKIIKAAMKKNGGLKGLALEKVKKLEDRLEKDVARLGSDAMLTDEQIASGSGGAETPLDYAMPGVDSVPGPLRKNILYWLEDALFSDERLKEVVSPKQYISSKMHHQMPLKAKDVHLLKQMLPKHDKYDAKDAHMWKDEVLDGYCNHIKNYCYTYKPKAQELDGRIDPSEKHIGPMAQDIEKVNPACVKENEEGYKSVDTGRLALMNAGAIASLARKVQELEAKNG